MTYKGSCHCGQVAYEVEGELQGVMECNCSLCSRKGAKMWFVPHDKFRLLTDEGNSGSYLFNKHLIEHRFCRSCGIHAYAVGSDRQANRMVMINVRCLEDVDFESLPVKHFDGRSL